MTHRRERDIRRMVAELGMEITSFRMDGGSHWRVDVKTPNGRQRPFTFPTRDNGNFHSVRNEVAALRRWRREVMPELDAAEEAGTLTIPDTMKGSLAQKLEALHIPLKTDSPLSVGGKTIRFDDKPRSEPPFPLKREPITTVTATPKEPSVQPQAATPSPPRAQHRQRREMSFSDVLKFGAWMSPDKLEGYFTKPAFLEHASRAMGVHVSETALDAWLKDNNVEMPKRPDRPKTREESLSDDLASIALALADCAPSHREAMMAIVERRTKA